MDLENIYEFKFPFMGSEVLQFTIEDREVCIKYGVNTIQRITLEDSQHYKQLRIEYFKALAITEKGKQEGIEKRIEEIDMKRDTNERGPAFYYPFDIEYILGISNIVKRTCKKLGITYKELGEAIGYSEGSLKTAVSTNKISGSMIKAIELYVRNLELEKELENSNKIKSTLKEWLK
jgi:hypothetical protein